MRWKPNLTIVLILWLSAVSCSDDDGDTVVGETPDADAVGPDVEQDALTDVSVEPRDDLVDPEDTLQDLPFEETTDLISDQADLDMVVDVGGDVIGITQIPGEPDEPAQEHIPEVAFPSAVEEDFVVFEELAISHRELLATVAAEATVEELNDVLADYHATITGALPGGRVLLIRIDLEELADMATVLQQLSDESVFDLVLPEIAGTPEYVARRQNFPVDFRWDVPNYPNGPGDGGNWGLEMVRAPQLWNLDDFVRTNRNTFGVSAAVEDAGFTDTVETATPSSHPDFIRPDGSVVLYTEVGWVGDRVQGDEHGTFVAGIIGAVWSNREGVEGIDPWLSHIYGRADVFGRSMLAWSHQLAEIQVVLRDYPDVRAINNSHGLTRHYQVCDFLDGGAVRSFNPAVVEFGDMNGNGTHDESWTVPYDVSEVGQDADGDGILEGFDFDNDGSIDTWADVVGFYGNLYHAETDPSVIGRDDYFLVSSAGNVGPHYQAVWGSPISAAAVNHGDWFITVESIDINNTASSFSNVGGSVSAPGGCVRSTELTGSGSYDETHCQSGGTEVWWVDELDDDYATASGTSFAAPFVTGLITALWKLDPDLTQAQMRSLITSNETTLPTLGGTARHIDAFAAAMGIDTLRGNQNMQRALADVDDGTIDGSMRTHIGPDGTVDNEFNHDAYYISGANARPQTRGDGQINMADFRAFRDALLLVENAEGTVLDGAPLHTHRDLNGNALIESPQRENTFPRFDLNGDGILSRTAVPRDADLLVPAHFVDMTDLQVLQDLWPADGELTEFVSVSQLPGLLASGDIELHADEILALGADFLTFDITAEGHETIVRGLLPEDHCRPSMTDESCIIVTLPAGVTFTIAGTGYTSGEVDIPASGQSVNLLVGEHRRLDFCA